MKRVLLLVAAMIAVNAATPDAAELKRMAARFARVELKVDTSQLAPGDRQALAKLIQAARIIDDIFLDQYWSGNHALLAELRKDNSPLGRERLNYFWLNKGPWSALDNHQAFLPGVSAHKPPGANFYPEDMTREEFETWVKTLPGEEQELAKGFFTVIRRGENRALRIVPYDEAYRDRLAKAAQLLREAAALTPNETLKRFLETRAAAFLSNDYYESDIAWMDLNAPIDITIGPYETYNDELFGYKASYECYVTLRDEKESQKLAFFSSHLQEVENNLPIDPKYRNPKLGAAAPIRVVNEILSTGDAAHGVRTAAFNLPNDERVVQQKGSKRVMLKNIQEAKFRSTLAPIAGRVLPKATQKDLSFDMFFTHILAHELSHGIGPHEITVGERKTNPRQELKELYSALEEAKADITGLFMLQYLMDQEMIPKDYRRLYTTFLASAFRSLRFGVNEAHGRGMALQFNYLWDKGAFVQNQDGTFGVNMANIRLAVRDLTHDLLTLEATGDYAGAKSMLDRLAVLRPPVKQALADLEDIPVDIDPIPVTADQVAGK
jgi:Peptidase family M49